MTFRSLNSVAHWMLELDYGHSLVRIGPGIVPIDGWLQRREVSYTIRHGVGFSAAGAFSRRARLLPRKTSVNKRLQGLRS